MTYRTLTPIFDELRGERVLIRPLRLADAPLIHDAVLASQTEMLPFLPFTKDYAPDNVDLSRDFVTRSMAEWLTRTNFNCSLWDLSGERHLGNIGLHTSNWEIRSFEIGYWLRTDASGHGYMSEAVRLLTDYAFDHLAACRVMIRCDARNERSAAIPRRLGFVFEGCLRQSEPDTTGEGLRDMLYFALVRSDPRWP
jgi:ribosomal-protein-serine acetyltransferase